MDITDVARIVSTTILTAVDNIFYGGSVINAGVLSNDFVDSGFWKTEALRLVKWRQIWSAANSKSQAFPAH